MFSLFVSCLLLLTAVCAADNNQRSVTIAFTNPKSTCYAKDSSLTFTSTTTNNLRGGENGGDRGNENKKRDGGSESDNNNNNNRIVVNNTFTTTPTVTVTGACANKTVVNSGSSYVCTRTFLYPSALQVDVSFVTNWSTQRVHHDGGNGKREAEEHEQDGERAGSDSYSGSFYLLPSITVTDVSNVKCKGGSDGSFKVTITAASATFPYTVTVTGPVSSSYTIASSAANSVTVSGLSNGTYSVSAVSTVATLTECTTAVNQDVSEPTLLTLSTTQKQPLCTTNAGTITASGAGGTPGYQYSINSGSFVASGVFSNLVAGVYTITVRDANNCTAQSVVTLDCYRLCSHNVEYYFEHLDTFLANCPTVAGGPCAPICTKKTSSGSTYTKFSEVKSMKSGPAKSAAKQFVAFVLNFFLYNRHENIRTYTDVIQFNNAYPGFPADISDAFISLNTNCFSLIQNVTLFGNAKFLASFNDVDGDDKKKREEGHDGEHEEPRFPWLDRCPGDNEHEEEDDDHHDGHSKRATTLISQMKSKQQKK